MQILFFPHISRNLRAICYRSIQIRLSSTAAVDNTKPIVDKSVETKLNLSETCIKKLEEISKRENNKFLRIIVDGGGCSGFQYKFELDDNVNEDDVTFGSDNGKIIIDTVSLGFCSGATIDYQIELIKSGFRVINNPKADQGCSCGASFALKL